MKRLLAIPLFLGVFAMAPGISSQARADNHCTCSEQCQKDCADGKGEACTCDSCSCSESGECSHGKCEHGDKKAKKAKKKAEKKAKKDAVKN